MRKTYIAPAMQCVGMNTENFLCYSTHDDEATQLTGRKDLDQGGWNSADWTQEKE